MPCNQVIKIGIEIKNLNRDILESALQRDGWNVYKRGDVIYATKEGRTIQIHPGRAVVDQGDEYLVKRMQLAFSKEVVRRAAKQYGFNVQAVPGKHNTWDVIKQGS